MTILWFSSVPSIPAKLCQSYHTITARETFSQHFINAYDGKHQLKPFLLTFFWIFMCFVLGNLLHFQTKDTQWMWVGCFPPESLLCRCYTKEASSLALLWPSSALSLNKHYHFQHQLRRQNIQRECLMDCSSAANNIEETAEFQPIFRGNTHKDKDKDKLRRLCSF